MRCTVVNVTCSCTSIYVHCVEHNNNNKYLPLRSASLFRPLTTLLEFQVSVRDNVILEYLPIKVYFVRMENVNGRFNRSQ